MLPKFIALSHRLVTALCLTVLITVVTTNVALADSVTITLTGTSGVTSSQGVTVGPLPITVNGAPMVIICDDFDHSVRVGQSWQASASTLTNLSSARFGNQPGALQNYQMAGWLFDQFAVNPASNYAGIQNAIWGIFSPNAPVNADTLYWLNRALSVDFAKYDLSTLVIYTPLDRTPSSPQEFIGRRTPIINADTPEPTTLLLMGSGLFGIGTMIRRRGNKARE